MLEKTPKPPSLLKQPPQTALERRKARQKRVQKLAKSIGLPAGAGMGLSATVTLILNGQWEAALVSGLLTVAVTLFAIGGKFVTEVTNLVLDKIETRLEQLSPVLADWTVSQIEHLIMKLWWGLTSHFQGKYYQDLYYTYRTYRTDGITVKFIPDLEQMFVPLRVASRAPGLISSTMIQKQESTGNLHIWDFLAESPKQPAYKHIVVIGAPGSGKTTLLESLTLTYAKNTQRKQHRKAPKLIPILLKLRQIHEEITINNPPNLAQLVTTWIRDKESALTLNPPPQWFEERLKQGKCLVMLDGLDEVANETQRQIVSRWVDKQMKLYPETHFIMTSRPFGYRNAQLTKGRLSLEVQPYNLHQTQQYIHQWYLQNEVIRQGRREDPGVRMEAKKKANDLIWRIKNYPPLADMARNPLLLTMMATVHDNRGALPGSRKELYAEICEVLLLRRQDAKGLTDEKIKLRAEQKQSVLQVLALALMKRNTSQFTFELGKELIRAQLAAVAGNGVRPEDFIKHSEQISGLLVEKEVEYYEFVHLSFQEYLAGVQLKETGQEKVLLKNIDQSWWRETIHLYAAGNDTTNLVRAALKNPSVVSLTIAHGCLEEGKSLDPKVRQQLEEMLENGLDSADSEMMKLSVGVRLAKRLNNLLRIDDKRYIDMSYITCAEYQLFIDEKRNIDQFFQPDHWTFDHFVSTMAKQPITGVRASDAKEFCEWLTQRHHPQEFRYRLPTLAEAEAHHVQAKSLGCWCQDEQKLGIAGIESEQWQIWRDVLYREVTNNFNFIPTHTRMFTRELVREFASDLAPFFTHVSHLENALAQNHSNNLVNVDDFICAYNHTLNCLHDLILELAQAGNLTRIHNLDQDLPPTLNSIQDRFFTNFNAEDCASKLTQNLTYAIDLANDLAVAQKSINNLKTNLKSLSNRVHELSNQLTKACELAPQLALNLSYERERKLGTELAHTRKLAYRLAHELSHDLGKACNYARHLDRIIVKADNICSDLSNVRKLVEELTDAYKKAVKLYQKLDNSNTLVVNTYEKLRSYSEILAHNLEDVRSLVRQLSGQWKGIPANHLARRGDLSCIRYYWLLILGINSRLCKLYQEASSNDKLLKAIKLNYKDCQVLTSEFITRSREAEEFFTFFMLLEARRAMRIPPCEGIRIVRESVED